MLALSLVEMLFAVEKQPGLYRKRIEELFESHPDHDLFGSLPGAGPKLAPPFLAEIGDARERFEGDAPKPPVLRRHCTSDQTLRPTSGVPSALSLVISTCATPYICFPNKVLPAVPGPRPTTKPTALKITPMPDRYVA
jgi:hypothetical protein